MAKTQPESQFSAPKRGRGNRTAENVQHSKEQIGITWLCTASFKLETYTVTKPLFHCYTMNNNRKKMVLVSEIKGIQDVFNTLKSEYIAPSVRHRLSKIQRFQKILNDKGQIKLYDLKYASSFF